MPVRKRAGNANSEGGGTGTGSGSGTGTDYHSCKSVHRASLPIF